MFCDFLGGLGEGYRQGVGCLMMEFPPSVELWAVFQKKRSWVFFGIECQIMAISLVVGCFTIGFFSLVVRCFLLVTFPLVVGFLPLVNVPIFLWAIHYKNMLAYSDSAPSQFPMFIHFLWLIPDQICCFWPAGHTDANICLGDMWGWDGTLEPH